MARRVFQRDGHSASTREIAKAAGISQAVLYQRFNSKEQLFFRAMMPAPPNLDLLVGESEGVDARAYLTGVCRRLLQHFRENMPVVFHLATHPAFEMARLDQAHEHLLAGQLQRELRDKLRHLRAAGLVADLDPDAVARTIIAITHSVAMHEMLGTGQQLANSVAAVDGMLSVVWRGVQPLDNGLTSPEQNGTGGDKS